MVIGVSISSVKRQHVLRMVMLKAPTTPEDAAAYMLDALAARSSCHVTDLFIGRNS